WSRHKCRTILEQIFTSLKGQIEVKDQEQKIKLQIRKNTFFQKQLLDMSCQKNYFSLNEWINYLDIN
ncbi:hypothetical protein BpHYR1_037265, partial [Brachionus plicatilis]